MLFVWLKHETYFHLLPLYPEEDGDDFIILSTNKNPVIDLEDDDDSPPFILFSSSGPAA